MEISTSIGFDMVVGLSKKANEFWKEMCILSIKDGIFMLTLW